MSSLQVGCCISAHGFGHAARTMAVMEALSKLADIELTVVTMVPEWFLRGSFSGHITIHPLQTDVGIVQRSALEQDIPATLQALTDYYPLRPQVVRSLASIFQSCRAVICDISPAGILASRQAGIPSVLVENFTWEWIYEGYTAFYPDFEPFIQYLRDLNRQADFRVQTVPVCDPVDADLVVAPVARAVRENRDLVRRRLGVTENERLVLLSMGGMGMGQLPLERLQAVCNTVFVLAGCPGDPVRKDNLVVLPPDTEFFHPDLVAASDAVVGKAGYSTLAEIYHAGVPFGFVSRPDFRESGPLVSFIRQEMIGMEIDALEFSRGDWVEMLPQLVRQDRKAPVPQNGAGQCAEFILAHLGP